MLICLGGFTGSGRQGLAEKIARRLNFTYYNTRDRKMRPIVVVNDQAEPEIEYFTSEQDKMLLYKKILEDLPLLSKMYDGVVLEDEFHRRHPREYLFTEAAKHFDKVIFVWVDADEEHVENKMHIMALKGIMPSIQHGFTRRAKEQEDFEPFTEQPLTFRHGFSNEAAAVRLIEYIREQVPELGISASASK